MLFVWINLICQAEKVKEEVNSWAEKETKGLIKEVLSPITKLEPPLCLANAYCTLKQLGKRHSEPLILLMMKTFTFSMEKPPKPLS